MNIRKTKTIALPLKATSKVVSICDEIKEKTGEFVSIGKMIEFMIDNFGKLSTDLKIKNILNERDNIEVVEIEQLINELENR